MSTAIIVNSDTFGNGPDELGHQLMGSYLRKLWSLDPKPDRILFYNSGAKLVAEGSQVLDALHGLADAGVDLIACGTCVTYFDLKDKIAVGRVSDMEEIATTMLAADITITI